MPVQVSSSAKVPLDMPAESGVESDVRNVLAKMDQLKQKKTPWLDQYQLLGEFIHMRKQEFQSQHTVGEFLTRDIFDATGPKAAKTAASMLVAMLWPNTRNRINFEPPTSLEGTAEEKEYYERATNILLDVMDDPKAGFALATDEYMLDEVVFGTAGVEIVKDKKTKVRYTPWGVTNMYIDEGVHHEIDTIYIEMETNNQFLVKTYGIDAVSTKVREAFERGEYDGKQMLIMAIEPRISRVLGKAGNKNLPFQSIHIEKEAKHKLKESGFSEMPIIVGRLIKLLGEVYARSLAMDAVPDILELNTLWESTTIAIEKSMDPALGVYSDGVLGGGEIDTSAGAISVFNPSDQAKDRSPIFELHQIGEFRQIIGLLEHLKESISDHFLIDRLLDFNNETRMTATETNIRDRDRNATLHMVLNGQIARYFTPCIERTFNLLLEDGHMGVMPNSEAAQEPGAFVIPETIAKLITSGQDVYKIKYTTPATRIMQAEEVGGILETLDVVERLVNIGMEDTVDNLDGDEIVNIISRITGSPPKILRALGKVKKMRDERDAAAAEQAEMEQAQAVTEGMRNVGQSGLVPLDQQGPPQ